VVARFSTGSFLLSRSDVESIGVPVQEESLQEVELRCPTGPRKLFAKLRLAGLQPSVTTDNLIEMACQDCRRRFRTEGRDVQLVLHRYNIIGDLIETVVVNRES
jgi:hypothetical protein